MNTDAEKMRTKEQEKKLLALARSPRPSAMEMGTDEPTPTRSASEKLIMTKGMARLTAANAASPSRCPIKAPSMML